MCRYTGSDVPLCTTAAGLSTVGADSAETEQATHEREATTND
jgi:hypothetical protein